MIISEVNSGRKAEYSLAGTSLTVGNTTIDLQERQESIQKVIDISLARDMIQTREGVGAWYVATIVIPPKERELYDSGEVDEQGNPKMAERELPLDMSKVELRLWGLPDNFGQSTNGGEI